MLNEIDGIHDKVATKDPPVERISWMKTRLMPELADTALESRNKEMLEAILDHHDGRYNWWLSYELDRLKHEDGNEEIVQLIENSNFRSIVPPGKRFKDLHPLDYTH
jgi:hypothetical protein